MAILGHKRRQRAHDANQLSFENLWAAPEAAPPAAQTPPPELPPDEDAALAPLAPPVLVVPPPAAERARPGTPAQARANLDAIETLHRLEAEQRLATPDERALLSRWRGWGSLPQMFDDNDQRFIPERRRMEALLTAGQVTAARRTTLNAHYTRPDIVEAMWSALQELGVTEGEVFEPGCGSGAFFDAAPPGISMVGVELDPITAGIASALHPNHKVIRADLAAADLGEARFVAAIGNVPFADFAPYDRAGNPERMSLHNYVIAKSIHLVRPGGVVALLTSRYTLDSRSTTARQRFAREADLICALRFPEGTHRHHAGTDVVTDLVVFRRRDAATPPGGEQFIDTDLTTIDGTEQRISSYFAAHPDHVLGHFATTRGMYNDHELSVVGDIEHIADQVRETLTRAIAPRDTTATATPAHVAEPPAQSAASQPVSPAETKAAPQGGHLAPEPVAVPAPPVSLTEPPAQSAAPQPVSPAAAAETKTAPQVVAPTPLPAAVQAPPPPVVVKAPEVIIDRARRPPGSIFFESGQFWIIDRYQAVPYTGCPKSQVAELRALIEMRDTYLTMLDAERAGNETWVGLQQVLNERYDAYVERYGPLNRVKLTEISAAEDDDEGNNEMPHYRRTYPRRGGWRKDPHAPTLAGIEHYDETTGKASKAAVLRQRVLGPTVPPTSAETPAEALAYSLTRSATVDLDYIASLLGCTASDAREALGTLVFDDPETGKLETQALYCAGNVRERLAVAREAAEQDPRFLPNVAALEAVMPQQLTAEEIRVKLGAPWIDDTHVTDFAHEVLGQTWMTVHRLGPAKWDLTGSVQTYGSLATVTWGTQRVNSGELLMDCLEGKLHTVRDNLGTSGAPRYVVNPGETIAARERQEKIEEAFASWIFSDEKRAAPLVEKYNELFCSTVVPHFDGSHLRPPGLSEAFNPHPHQLDAVWRVITSPTTLLAHAVGAGKTAEMVIAAMEMKRLGLVKKPAIVVPNHMLDQFSREFAQTYPGARILLAGKDDMSKQRRKEFVGRAAAGDWDAVIFTYSTFQALNVSTETETGYIDDTVQAAISAMIESARAVEASAPYQARNTTKLIKRLEKKRAGIEEKQKARLATDARDDGLWFEAVGIDFLFLDEAHYFKNLSIESAERSMSKQGSKRATDLDCKLYWLRRQREQVACFATATPVANSLAEMWVMQHYLGYKDLDRTGLANFDDWAATFGESVTTLEMGPDGTFRMATRFARFANVPELLRMFHAFADVANQDKLGLTRPPIKGGRPEIVVTEPTDEARTYLSSLVDRAAAIRNRAVRPEEDNMLKVTTDGRKLALDDRLVGLNEPVTGGKIAACAERTAAVYHENKDNVYPYPGLGDEDHERKGALQLVFCDLSTPKKDDWNAYDQLRSELVQRGVPSQLIRYIHEAPDDKAKAHLFEACRTGEVAVLVGSTDKMGIGTNVQLRAVALHHLDCPWRPVDIEQREGRVLRQGNANAEVDIVRYVTEGTFDAYLWQTVERKATFIAQVLHGESTERSIEDLSVDSLSYAEVKAIASGRPEVMEKAKVDMEVARLSRLATAYADSHRRLRTQVANQSDALDRSRTKAAYLASLIEVRDATPDTALIVDGRTYEHPTDTANALHDQLTKVTTGPSERARKVATYAGIGIYATKIETLKEDRPSQIALSVEGNTVSTEPFTPITTEAGRLGVIRRISNLVAGLDTRLTEIQDRIGSYEANIADAAVELDQPFTHAAELAHLRSRQAALLQVLSNEATGEEDLDDIASSDASSGDDSSSDDTSHDDWDDKTDDGDEAMRPHIAPAPPAAQRQTTEAAWAY